MNRFFVNPEKIVDDVVDIEGKDAVHILRVLRLKEGDSIEVCDGVGNDYNGTIIKTGKNWVQVLLKDVKPSKGEPEVRVTLYQGIPKANKMDLIIQKSVELGIYSIVPVITTRTVVNLSSTKKEKKVARWQKIAEEAAKQCKRGIIPRVQEPVLFDEAIDNPSDSLKLLPWEGDSHVSLRDALAEAGRIQDISIFIGPEGGFEREEVLEAEKLGWNVVTLGPRILRTETAGIAVLSAIMFHMEEME